MPVKHHLSSTMATLKSQTIATGSNLLKFLLCWDPSRPMFSAFTASRSSFHTSNTQIPKIHNEDEDMRVCQCEWKMSPPLPYRPYCTKEDEEGLYMWLEMPGVGKEGMRIWVENETVFFEGKELKDENEAIARHYSGSLSTFIASYELNETKATMKNGVLRMMIPKKKKKKLE